MEGVARVGGAWSQRVEAVGWASRTLPVPSLPSLPQTGVGSEPFVSETSGQLGVRAEMLRVLSMGRRSTARAPR